MQQMVVLTMIYNLEEQPMTLMEHTRFVPAPVPGRRGSDDFHQLELPQK
jgi:hypothetical protein